MSCPSGGTQGWSYLLRSDETTPVALRRTWRLRSTLDGDEPRHGRGGGSVDPSCDTCPATATTQPLLLDLECVQEALGRDGRHHRGPWPTGAAWRLYGPRVADRRPERHVFHLQRWPFRSGGSAATSAATRCAFNGSYRSARATIGHRPGCARRAHDRAQVVRYLSRANSLANAHKGFRATPSKQHWDNAVETDH